MQDCFFLKGPAKVKKNCQPWFLNLVLIFLHKYGMKWKPEAHMVVRISPDPNPTWTQIEPDTNPNMIRTWQTQVGSPQLYAWNGTGSAWLMKFKIGLKSRVLVVFFCTGMVWNGKTHSNRKLIFIWWYKNTTTTHW